MIQFRTRRFVLVRNHNSAGRAVTRIFRVAGYDDDDDIQGDDD